MLARELVFEFVGRAAENCGVEEGADDVI